jgi:acyl-CoA synthetase (AMP-forming)/AMP-acid ligase II
VDQLNASDYLLERGAAGDVAIVDTGRHHTYAELRNAAGRLVAELAALRLPAGSPVGILAPNSFFWIAAYLAVMKLNHVAVPLSDRITPDDVRREINLVGCSAVLVDRRSRRRFADALQGVAALITDKAVESDREPFWPVSGHGEPGADAALMFTSGTTSQPRAVRVTHRNIRANTESIINYLQLRVEDRVLVVLPFHYCYGASLLHTHLRVGGRVVLMNSFAFPESALDLLEREECTVFAGVPSSFQLLLRASSFATRELPSLRLIQQAGGKLPVVLVEELLGAANRAQLFLMYGQTEATARLSYLPPGDLREKPGSIGRGIPGVELRVLDEEGRPVAPGECGEIYARGENICPGYLGDPEGSASKFTPDGLRTGDLATVDDDGYLFIVDRRDDFIKSWGHRVSSQEIEACALRVGQLLSAAAVGVPDLAAGEAITLFVTARPGAGVTPDQVARICRAHLPKHMVPRSVVVVAAMPLSTNGKIAKGRLRELAMAGSVGEGQG